MDLRAKNALLIDIETREILYEKNSAQRVCPASLTKIATALYALEKNIRLSRVITVSSEAVHLRAGGTSMGLIVGETIDLESVLYGLLLSSGNDAANVIAEAVSGTIPLFIAELNAYVKSIGCLSTNFTNPHGYQDAQHRSTVHDLCLLFTRAFLIPKFKEIFAKSHYLCPSTNKHVERELLQKNSLVVPESPFFYPNCLGGKTGHTNSAGWCLMSAAKVEEQTLIACVMGCPNDNARFEESRKLFDGFRT